MIDPNNVPHVGDDELLTRYVLQRSHFRPIDGTVKPDAFVPHPHRQLSVTRHLSATVGELWGIGEQVASLIQKPLYGRADIHVTDVVRQPLSIRAAPVPGNSNHADIEGWPSDKAQQKMVALELASAAEFIRRE